MVQISDLSQHEEQQVTLKGWVATRRTGGKIAFINSARWLRICGMCD